MKQYTDLVKDILDNGEVHENRTGVDTIRVWGRTITHDLQDGFPLLTTKKMAVKASFVEILGFMRGETNVNWYASRGCKVWNANHEDWHGKQLEADKQKLQEAFSGLNSLSEEAIVNLEQSISFRHENPDSLGYVYGYQWRNMNGFDQLGHIVDQVKKRSNSRRLIMSGWNPSEGHMMCLPPCHILYHFAVRGDFLDIAMTQRSADVFLGVPFNLANTALMCHLVANCAGLKPGKMVWTGNDVHIYSDHVEQCNIQISRDIRPLPVLKISGVKDPWDVEFEDIEIVGYDPHPKLVGKMAI